MCGIVGYVGLKQAKSILLDGLRRLEYRGYDSAGYALYLDEQKDSFHVRRCVGPVQSLVDLTEKETTSATQGIAHTRWATHGVPSEVNAHPHQSGELVLVHNGIIENHAELKSELVQKGYKFSSQTDTEVFAALLESLRLDFLKSKSLDWARLDGKTRTEVVNFATKLAESKVQGHYSVLFVVNGIPRKLFGLQKGAPLAVVQTEHGVCVASDLQALIVHSQKICFLPTGVSFEIGEKSFQMTHLKSGKIIAPEFKTIDWSPEQVAKDGFEHFMLKEIFEQPRVVADTLSGRLPEGQSKSYIWDNPESHQQLWQHANKVVIVACGTAFHAALAAKYYFEEFARLPVEVDLASEYRYRNPIMEKGTVFGVVSQSGETADTLSALRLAMEKGLPTFAVCNVPGSTISREAGHVYYTKAGPEIGVASTKAFTTQLAIFAALCFDVARMRGKIVPADSLARIPIDMERVLQKAEQLQKLGASLANMKTILFVGRNTMYPIALEGALKLKEITYRHAEGYAAGELKHGPIALVDKNLAAVVLAPSDELLPKTLSNLEEIRSRGGHIIGIGEENNKQFESLCSEYVGLPKTSWAMAPLLYVLPLQLMSYGLAKALDCSIDKPRNLAKSVTVE